MRSSRRLRKRSRRLAARKVAAVAASLAEQSTSEPARAARLCWRCGRGCRTAKHPYGWACGQCARELDTYYTILSGMRGGDPHSLYAEDLRRGTVPVAGFKDLPDPPPRLR